MTQTVLNDLGVFPFNFYDNSVGNSAIILIDENPGMTQMVNGRTGT